MTYKLGSLFDGSGGFPLAGSLYGIEPKWAAEVEPYPIAVTRSSFPGMKHLGDISKVSGSEIEPVDIITFGSPCQDMSVAGKRAGLKHEANGDEETTRSGLFMEAVRIIKEMREATNGKYPRFALWENVPGAFSSNKGEDFRIVLEELIKICEPTAVMPAVPKNGWSYADCYCGDGWSLAYRVLDAQHWVPQRRRRIYLVADFGGERAGEVLFEREGLRGYFEEGRTPWQGVASDAERGTGTADFAGVGLDIYNLTATDTVACSLTTATGQGASNTGSSVCEFHLLQDPIPNSKVAPCMGQGNSDGGQAPIGVVHDVLACIDGDKIGKADRAGGSGLGIRDGDKMYTLTAKDAGSHSVCIPINDKATRYKGGGSDRKNDGSGNGLGVGKDGDPLPTLTAGDRHAVCCAEICKEATAYGVDRRNFTESPELYPTLQAKSNGGQSLNYSGAVRIRYIVRRLTPTECARLQGFPDYWGHPDGKDDFNDEEYKFWLNVRNTHAAINGKKVKDYTKKQMLAWYNKLHTDSSEYKMWGNGIALPCALYVMQGITDVLEGN